jgi:hypothetical protein
MAAALLAPAATAQPDAATEARTQTEARAQPGAGPAAAAPTGTAAAEQVAPARLDASERNQASAARTARDGVFAATQADRGRRTFNSICRDCHELEDVVGTGAYFDEMRDRSLWEVLDYIWSSMPEDLPASLEPEEYTAVLAYLLGAYGLPAGAEELSYRRAVLEPIRMVSPAPDARGTQP